MRGSSHLPAARVHTLLSLLLINLVNSADPPYPRFPLQFECRVEKTAHLVDRSKEYPPWLGVIEVRAALSCQCLSCPCPAPPHPYLPHH